MVARSNTSNSGVYPRVCGGTPQPAAPAYSPPGLSPRVRGNRGNTRLRNGGRRVYPRVCGGTPWQIDSFYSPLFAKGRWLAVFYQVHAVGIHDLLGWLPQTPDPLLTRRCRVPPGHYHRPIAQHLMPPHQHIQIRPLMPLVISGDVYIPGAISSITDARNPGTSLHVYRHYHRHQRSSSPVSSSGQPSIRLTSPVLSDTGPTSSGGTS